MWRSWCDSKLSGPVPQSYPSSRPRYAMASHGQPLTLISEPCSRRIPRSDEISPLFSVVQLRFFSEPQIPSSRQVTYLTYAHLCGRIMAATTKRNVLTRDTLKQNKISFRKDPAETARNPRGPHIRRLREILLDFDCTSPDKLGILPDDHLLDTTQSLEGRFRALNFPKKERLLINKSVDSYRNARQQALRLHNGKDREAEWSNFFSNRFFNPLEQEMEINPKDLRR